MIASSNTDTRVVLRTRNKYQSRTQWIFPSRYKNEYVPNVNAQVIEGIVSMDDLMTIIPIDDINIFNAKVSSYLNFPKPVIATDDELTLGQYIFCWERACWDRIINKKFPFGCPNLRIQAMCAHAIIETVKSVKLKILTFYLMKKYA